MAKDDDPGPIQLPADVRLVRRQVMPAARAVTMQPVDRLVDEGLP